MNKRMKRTLLAVLVLGELVADNKKVAVAMRECHEVCDKYGDVATASILENFIDQAERRVWFMFEASRKADHSGPLTSEAGNAIKRRGRPGLFQARLAHVFRRVRLPLVRKPVSTFRGSCARVGAIQAWNCA